MSKLFCWTMGLGFLLLVGGAGTSDLYGSTMEAVKVSGIGLLMMVCGLAGLYLCECLQDLHIKRRKKKYEPYRH